MHYFKLFAEIDYHSFTQDLNYALKEQIAQEKENYILNVNESTYIQHLIDKTTLDMPVLKFDEVFAESRDVVHRVEDYGRTLNKPGVIITYHIPIKGDTELLKIKPSTYIAWFFKVNIQNEHLCFELSDVHHTVEQLRAQYNQNIEHIQTQLAHLSTDIVQFNSQISNIARSYFNMRKKHFLNKNNMLAALGIPIRKSSNIPQTFSIPISPIRKPILRKPEVHEIGFTPEPTIDDSVYLEILQVIHDTGKTMERLPATYSGKGEEDLRDHFILNLEPRFEGSTTGETFNKKGKTDILVRHENKNIFIGECKYWTGQKGFLSTIDQLLGYLVWRDSKAAIIIFVGNKDIANVLNIAETAAPMHPNYLGFVNKRDDSWFNYRFHINDDKNREVKLAILLFHLPK